MPRFTRRVFLTLIGTLHLAFSSGCVNPATQFYRDLVPPGAASTLLPYSGTTQIYSSADMDRDAQSMRRRNYNCIGFSGFQGAVTLTDAMLREQAKKVGADVVLYASKYQGSQQVAVPYTQYQPGQTSTTTSTGTVNANAYGTGGYAYGNANYYGTSTTTTPGTFSTTVVPVTVQRYEYGISYWRRCKPPVFGVSGINLPDELRQKLQRNTGFLVAVVVDDSPAFRANVLPGDVVTAFNGHPILSMKDFLDKLPEVAGQHCMVTLLRDGKEQTVAVEMGNRL